MNPAMMMKIVGAKNKFSQNHPKFMTFLSAMFSKGIEEGTVIEITVTKPGQGAVTSNLRVTKDDLELLETLKEIGRG